MGKRKKAANASAEANKDAVQLSKQIFDGLPHVKTVFVNETTGDCFLREKKGTVEVTREQADSTEELEAETPTE